MKEIIEEELEKQSEKRNANDVEVELESIGLDEPVIETTDRINPNRIINDNE